jgi:hypothetical protein
MVLNLSIFINNNKKRKEIDMSIEWITHEGKKILYIKYSGLSYSEQLEQIERATQILVDTKTNDNLTLSDLTHSHINQDFVNLAKEKGKISAPFTKKAAVIGIEGVRKILLEVVNKISGNLRVPFSTIEEAKDWLVK